MKYIITRASVLYNATKPCEEAKKETVTYQDSDGKDIKHTDWVIEINSLEEFNNKYGDLVISKSNYKEVPTKIMIYDDYIE